MRALCGVLADYLARLRVVSISLTAPNDLREALDKLPELAQAADAAPADLRTDARGLANAVDRVRAGLAGAGFDLRRAGPDVVVGLQSPEVATSLARVEAWISKACR